jgi:hypothetical protein
MSVSSSCNEQRRNLGPGQAHRNGHRALPLAILEDVLPAACRRVLGFSGAEGRRFIKAFVVCCFSFRANSNICIALLCESENLESNTAAVIF